MGSLQAAGEHMTPAAGEFIFDTSLLPICHPSGAYDMHRQWDFNSTHFCRAVITYVHLNKFYLSNLL